MHGANMKIIIKFFFFKQFLEAEIDVYYTFTSFLM
jgi:hypothetical protein